MKKFMLLALALGLISFEPVFADVTNYNVELRDGMYTVSGLADDNSSDVTLEIINAEYTFDKDAATDVNLSNYKDASVYFDQIDFKDKDKSFSFSFPIDGGSRKLNARLNGTGYTNSTEFEISYVKYDDFAAARSELEKNMSDAETYKTFMDRANNAFLLGCDVLPDGAERDRVYQIMYSTLKGGGYSISSMDFGAMQRLWNKCATLDLINVKKITNISDYKNNLDLTDMGDAVVNWYNRVEKTENAMPKLSALITSKTYSNVQAFDDAMKKNLVLTVVKYPDGISNIGKIMVDFSNLTGITSSNETDKYRTVAGMDFGTFDEYIRYYKNLSSNSGNGGNSGSSGSSGRGSGGFVSSGSVSGDTNAPQEQVKMPFIDLDTVPWAYEAISTLSDKGIINGREENKFVPDDEVTREEFTKMCVVMMNLDVTDQSIVFDDEKDGEWYLGYISAARKNNIVSGKGDGSFGIGEAISRQDAAVILYNILKNNGLSNDKGIDFDDSDMISDYAIDAINVLSANSVINGVGDNMFSPLGRLTRAEAAKLIFESIKYIK
ncbi:MAG: S-layer homology domain-containing protein [Eubacteriales bacterium]|nr:S-layer homology domain-containing protein [Eubacteriales bacterium]